MAHKHDGTSMMLEAVQENIRILESMDKQRLEMQYRHDEEMQLLQMHSQEELEACTSALEEQLESERAAMVRDMENFKVECEASVAKERADCQRQVEELRAEYQRKCEEGIATIKAEKDGEITDSRTQCEQLLITERAEMTEVMASYRRKCESSMAKERADCQRRVEHVRVEYERKCEEYFATVQAEKVGDITDTYVQWEQLSISEGADMTEAIAAYRKQCETLIVKERVQCHKRVENLRVEYQRKCEEGIALIKSEMAADCEQNGQHLTQNQEEIAETIAKVREQWATHSDEAEDVPATESKLQKDDKDASVMEPKLQKDAKAYIAKQEKALLHRVHEAKAECECVTKEKDRMIREMTKLREDAELKMAQEKADLLKSMAESREQCFLLIAQEKEDTAKKMAEAQVERERVEAEKAVIARKMGQHSFDMQRKILEEQSNMELKVAEAKAQCERVIAEEKVKLASEMTEFERDFEERTADEKSRLTQQMAETREECERLAEQKATMEKELKKMELDKRAMQIKMTQTRSEYIKMLKEEKANAERTLEDARKQTEDQLQRERQVTASIMQAIRELPPLQAAMELGDLTKLEQELAKHKTDELPERFGDCKVVVEAVVKLARERLIIWREVDRTMKDVMQQMQRLPRSVSTLAEHCQRLFRALKDAQLTKMDVRRSDPKATEHISQVLLAWQSRAMANSNSVQKSMITKVAKTPNLGSFDFVDLDICLRLVDRSEEGNHVFLSRALVLVQDPATALKRLRPLLSHLETVLFFLKYTKTEDMALTYAEFKKQQARLDPAVIECLRWTEQEYPPGCELVRLEEHKDVMNRKDVSSLLEEIRTIPKNFKGTGLGHFREIFYQWALAMRSKFDLLVLPHHTQVVCLMMFRRFLEDTTFRFDGARALIAQVGTGEGKSMIVAILAIYVAVVLRKRVHVVVDDETLLERDFEAFKRVFDAFTVPDRNAKDRALTYMLCTSEDRLNIASKHEDARHLGTRIDANVDIAYCEAKHVQSFYASIARGEADFSSYANRVLILDEVDALVIDEEPNEAFVYPNQDLSNLATEIAQALMCGTSSNDLNRLEVQDPAAKRVLREMQSEWQRGKKMIAGEDFVFSNEAGKYYGLQSGRANPKAWSLAIECRNFQDGYSSEILFQERLFVMSRPRVFRKYRQILGLSGSIGSEAERSFLKQTYNATFFEVPPFLKTCVGSHFHEPVPIPLGKEQRAVYVEYTLEAQLNRIVEIAWDARERVPVLIIAKDRGHCEMIVDRLRIVGQKRGLSSKIDDVVRSLVRTLYESDPERWKENLNRATLPIVEDGGNRKTWRVTVTDPRGGRGTDYRVDDQDVDERGGLLLIPTLVPTSQREWTQFLGRTARQDRHGQFCAVLCVHDYDKLSAKYGQKLQFNGGVKAVETVLSWGDSEVAGKLRSSAALYNTGVRVNELCEEVFGHHKQLLNSSAVRECMVDVCQRFRWMSVGEIDNAFSGILDPNEVTTEAVDLGRPEEPPVGGAGFRHCAGEEATMSGFPGLVRGLAKVVIFCLDWSVSMTSQDTGAWGVTRFGLCVERIRKILREQVQDCDLVGVVGFGAKVETVFAPMPKARNAAGFDAKLLSLRPDNSGGTCFFDAVAQCLQLLRQHPQELPRWLVCLTDGDDAGSCRENSSGQLVTAMLHQGVANLNMMMITVGSLQAQNIRVIDSWVERVVACGGIGRHLSERNAGAISKAFQVVAEILAAEVGGAVEC